MTRWPVRTAAEDNTGSRNTYPRLLCYLLIITILPAFTGCSTITASDTYNAELRDEIRAGNRIKIDDHVIIHTQDNVRHEFVVTQIDQEHIEGAAVSIPVGARVSVPIDDIVALKTKSISVEKTVGLTAATGFSLYILYYAVVLASIGLLF